MEMVRSRLHWLAFAALAAVPLLGHFHWVFSGAVEALLGRAPESLRIEAALARIMLLAWFICFVLAQWQPRLSVWWKESASHRYGTIPLAGCIAIIALFVILLFSTGMSPFFSSQGGDKVVPLPPPYGEDGPAEVTAVLLLLLAIPAILMKAASTWRQSALRGVLLVLLAVMVFLFAGEEISWGQRLFGWSSGQFFQDNNVQAETNLHNMISWNMMAYLTALFYVGVALLTTYWKDLTATGPLRVLAALGPAPGVSLGLMTLPLAFSLVAYNELAEEVLSWLILCYAISLNAGGSEERRHG